MGFPVPQSMTNLKEMTKWLFMEKSRYRQDLGNDMPYTLDRKDMIGQDGEQIELGDEFNRMRTHNIHDEVCAPPMLTTTISLCCTCADHQLINSSIIVFHRVRQISGSS